MNEKPDKSEISFETEGNLYETIASNVQEILSSSEPGSAISPYLLSFHSSFKCFDQAYHKNIRLLEMIQEMNATIVSNASKIKAILDLTNSDSNTLGKLKSEYEEAQNVISYAHQSEKKAKTIIMALRNSITKLTGQVQRGEAFSYGEEGFLYENTQEVTNLKNELKNVLTQKKEIEEQIHEAKANTKQLQGDYEILSNEANRLNAAIDSVNKQIEELNSQNEENDKNLINLKPQITNQHHEVESRKNRKVEITKSCASLKNQLHDKLTILSANRDETKSRKDRISNREKYLNSIKTSSNNKNQAFQENVKTIHQKEEEILELKKELEIVKKEGEDKTLQYEDSLNIAKEISEKKSEVRRHMKELRQQLIDVKYDVLQGQNNNLLENRHIAVSQEELSKTKSEHSEAKQLTKEAIGDRKNVKSETSVVKNNLQMFKEKILNLMNEIDMRRSELYSIKSKTQMAYDTNKSLISQHDNQLDSLNELKSKTTDQSSLIDQLLQERNMYKRQYEAAKQEGEELANQIEECQSNIKSLTKKLNHFKAGTIDEHFLSQETKANIHSMEQLNEEIASGIKETERTTTRLQTECTILNHILIESQHEALQRKKELELLQKNQESIGSSVTQRKNQMEELQSKIKSLEAYMAKCGSVYNEKKQEILNSLHELQVLDEQTQELQVKQERLNALEYEKHQLESDSNVEKLCASSLVHEFSIQRNVHRWHMLEAVDPGYVKQLQYRASLFGRLDNAHKTLIKLRSEKEKLQNQQQKLKQTLSDSPNAAIVQQHINTYKEVIAKKEAKIAQFKNEIEIQRKPVRESVSQVDEMKFKVIEKRKLNAILSTTTSLNNRKLMEQKNNGWFLTEVPVERVSGFVFTTEQNPMEYQSEIPTSLTVTQQTRTKRAHTSMMSMFNNPKIKKPQSTTCASPKRKVEN